MADPYLFGTSSLYNPKTDDRYSDLTGKQPEFDFASRWNTETAGAQARQRQQQAIESSNIALDETRSKKDAMSSPDFVDGLANAKTPEEVEDLFRNVAIESQDYDSLLKLEERRMERVDAQETAKMAKILQIRQVDPALATRMWDQEFGQKFGELRPTFGKKDRYNTKDGIIEIDSEGGSKVLYKTNGGAGKSEMVEGYDEFGNYGRWPITNLPNKFRKTAPPIKLTPDEITAAAAAKKKGEMQGEMQGLMAYKNGGSPSSTPNPSLTPKPNAPVEQYYTRKKK